MKVNDILSGLQEKGGLQVMRENVNGENVTG